MGKGTAFVSVDISSLIVKGVCYRKATGQAGLDWPGPVTDDNIDEYELHLRCSGCDGMNSECPDYISITDPQFGK